MRKKLFTSKSYFHSSKKVYFRWGCQSWWENVHSKPENLTFLAAFLLGSIWSKVNFSEKSFLYQKRLFSTKSDFSLPNAHSLEGKGAFSTKAHLQLRKGAWCIWPFTLHPGLTQTVRHTMWLRVPLCHRGSEVAHATRHWPIGNFKIRRW